MKKYCVFVFTQEAPWLCLPWTLCGWKHYLLASLPGDSGSIDGRILPFLPISSRSSLSDHVWLLPSPPGTVSKGSSICLLHSFSVTRPPFILSPQCLCLLLLHPFLLNLFLKATSPGSPLHLQSEKAQCAPVELRASCGSRHSSASSCRSLTELSSSESCLVSWAVLIVWDLGSY